ncbi:MAG: CheW domain-containing protein [Legionella sp.]|nr:CheW domain-containing protein [Legionella sp.]
MKEVAVKHEANQSIFDMRAKELAKILDDKTKRAGTSFLVFCLGTGKNEKYALPYQHIEKVVPLHRLTVIPGAPNLFLGITYHNAEVWPVINTEVLLGFDSEKMQPEYVLLVRDGVYRYALAVRYILGHQHLEVEKNMTQLAGNQVKKNRYILGVWQSDISVIDDKAMFNFMNQMSLDSTF